MSIDAGSRRAALWLGVALAIFFLYFFGLTRTGLIGPDEARYAAIGRAMAATGDWVTPRLWGSAWFEKPALLYWMTAAGFKLGLGTELAPRLPVALASVSFLIYFFFVLRREFGERTAWYAAAILATSAGWLAYSHIAITDLPMSAAFAAAMLEIMPDDSEPRTSVSGFVRSGVLLGIAVLAKGLVPLVLFIPAVSFLWRRWRDLAILFVAAAIVAAPWYVLVSARNPTFVNEFIWKHHFGRFLNSALQHGQPIWFYIPVVLAGLFPWTPALFLLAQRRVYQDRRALFLLSWFAWGFLFFSVSKNKLPGYLLPLLPALAVLMGVALDRSSHARYWLAACGALFCLAPPLVQALPQALANGLSHTPVHFGLPAVAAGLALAAMCLAGRPERGVAGLALFATITVVWIVLRVYPELDRQLSGRNASASITCLPQTNRSQRYSLDYYAGRDLPDCK
ncbi:MAG TPA: glycosyltransferase family 39 protein [Bryobacteraceae bacterium]|nr:glycosyltransferase family 39 protein [Bryobacteraceae bacterium]